MTTYRVDHVPTATSMRTLDREPVTTSWHTTSESARAEVKRLHESGIKRRIDWLDSQSVGPWVGEGL